MPSLNIKAAESENGADPQAPLLELVGLVKSFPGVRALRGVDFDVMPGEVHALVGENGAGKSTLIKILAGVYQADDGSLIVGGKEVQVSSAKHATELGFSFIHQDLNFVPNFNAIENMWLGNQLPRVGGVFVRWSELRRRAKSVADLMLIDFDLDIPVRELSQAQRVMLAICRALMQDSRLIVMDEPTAALSGHEVLRLYKLVKDLTNQGVSVVYVSHRLEEVFALADRVTVLKDGAKVGTYDIDALADTRHLTELIIGRSLEEMIGTHRRSAGDVRLAAENLVWGSKVRNVSLELRAGEIVGLAGLVGSGRSELARLLFGAERPDSGRIEVAGRPVRLASPKDAIDRGVALVPEDRRHQSGIMQMSVRENATLVSLGRYRIGPFIRRRLERTTVRRMIDRFSIKTPSVDAPLKDLSGGNQQKVLIGKWADSDAVVYIFDEPTQGVDVGAKQEIFSIIGDLADEGSAVLFISSELEEVVGIADRVLVMREGSLVAEIDHSEASVQRVLEHCYATPPA